MRMRSLKGSIAAVAGVYLQRIGEAIISYRRDREPEKILRGSLFAVAVFVVLGLLLWLGARAMYRLDAVLERRIKSKLEGLEAKSLRLLNAALLWRTLRHLRSPALDGNRAGRDPVLFRFRAAAFPLDAGFRATAV